MDIRIYKTNKPDLKASIAIIVTKGSKFEASFLSDKEYNFVKQSLEKGETQVLINQYTRLVFVIIIDTKKQSGDYLEDSRKAGNSVQSVLSEHKLETIKAFHSENNADILMAFTEGLVLGSYRFNKYQKKSNKDKTVPLKEVGLICQPLSKEEMTR